MSKWQLIRELCKGIGFYKKQFNLFIAIVCFTLTISGLLHYNSYMSADPMSGSSGDHRSDPQSIYLNITKDGRVFRDGHVVSMIELGKDYDELRYKILDKPGTLINNITVQADFEPDLSNQGILANVLSAHTGSGYEKDTTSYFKGAHTIIYTGDSLGPDTMFTIHARLPKGIISPPWWRSSAFNITSLSIWTWIAIGLFLPFLTFIILAIMLFKRWWYSRTPSGAMVTTPPEPIPAAIVGVLMHGRIGAREIAATLIDLAQREYIHIFEGQDNFSFGRGRAMESEKIYELNNYEKLLLSKIFEPNHSTSNIHDINTKLGKSLFSEKIAHVYLEIYHLVEQQGYFQQNPGLTHQKYKFSGMILFLIGSIGFVLNILFNETFPYLIFFWVGMMAASTLILFFAAKMPVLTPKGKAARQAWLGFRTYLIQKSTLSYEESAQSPYTKYLPYAIALDAETDWTGHFYTVPFARPGWFDSELSVNTIEDFANLLFPIIAYISQNLIVSRTPVID